MLALLVLSNVVAFIHGTLKFLETSCTRQILQSSRLPLALCTPSENLIQQMVINLQPYCEQPMHLLLFTIM